MLVVPVNVTGALGMMKGSIVIASVDQPYLTISYGAHARKGFLVNKNESVVAGVRNDE